MMRKTLTLLFLAIFIAKIKGDFDSSCIDQHLRKVKMINDDMFGVEYPGNRKCGKYISQLQGNFYKLWKYHYKHQTPVSNSDSSIRCFIKESMKYQLHDRYLLDMFLRKKTETDRKLFQRNNLIYDRLLREASEKCELSGY